MDTKYKKQLIGVRVNKEFIGDLDLICNKLGQKRSTVVRYALRKFIFDHSKSDANLKATYSELLYG
jgi:metal-responsive CopG/Arc/MetJ family transcriptional regulator